MATQFVIKKNTLSPGLKNLIKVSTDVRNRALTKAGLQGLNWMVNGSPKLSLVPPVLTGALRGSGSVFVGNKFITATPDKSGEGTPATSHNAKPNVITWGFNTAYAARIHESNWNPGAVSQTAGNVGNKWIRKHLKADKELLFEFIAKEYRKTF